MPRRMSRRRFAMSATSLAAALPSAHAHARQATPAASPETTSDALSRLPDLVREHMERTGVPGVAIGVVTPEETVFAEGFGVRDVSSGSGVDTGTIFQVASLSKPLSSTVVVAAVDTGEIRWDTPIADTGLDFALSDPWVTANVTIADLLSHRSGLPDHAGDLLEDLGASRDEVLYRLRYLELEGAFRDSYAYTNFGFTAAAVAAARAAGTTWEGLADERLFGPLGMSRSSFRYSDIVDDPNRARLHIRHDGEWVQEFERQPDAQAPAGGASASITDFCRWMRLQMGNGSLDGEEIIDSAALGMTHLAHTMSGTPEAPYATMPSYYGLGWNVGYDMGRNVTLSHSGAFALGAATAVYLRPADGIGIAVLTNGEPMGLPESICLSFLDLVSTGSIQVDYLSAIQPIIEAEVIPEYGDAVAGEPDRVDPPTSPQVYTGSYGNDFFGEMEVTEDGSNLTMRLGPLRLTFPLEHYSRDVFTYQPTGENAGGRSSVTFTLDATGSASQVVVENLDVYDAGTFTRL